MIHEIEESKINEELLRNYEYHEILTTVNNPNGIGFAELKVRAIRRQHKLSQCNEINKMAWKLVKIRVIRG